MKIRVVLGPFYLALIFSLCLIIAVSCQKSHNNVEESSSSVSLSESIEEVVT